MIKTMKNKYFRAGSTYLIGDLLNTGVAFLTIPVFTRILSTSDYGIVSTYLSWVGLASLILGLGLHMGVRSAFIDYENSIEDYMSSITTLGMFSTLIVSCIVLFIVYIFHINTSYFLIILCLFHSYSSSVILNHSVLLMMKLKYSLRSLLIVIPNLLSTATSLYVIVSILDANKYLGKIVPTAVVSILTATFLITTTFYKSQLKVNFSYWKHALKISLPIVFHGFSLTILSQSDRIMLTSLYSSSETGIYSIVYNIGMITMIIGTSLDGVWVPWFTKNLSQSNLSEINNRANTYITIMTVLVFGVLMISPEVIKVLAPEEYWSGIFIMPQIILSSFVIFIYSLYVNIEHFYKETKLIAINTTIAATTNVVLNLIFIPMFGMYAAASTTLVSYLISLYFHYRYARKINSNLLSYQIFARPLIFLVLSSLVYYLFIDNLWLRYSYVIFSSYLLIHSSKKSILVDLKEL